MVCVARLDASIVKGRADKWLRWGDALPGLIRLSGLSSIHNVSGEIGIRDWLPTEVDGCLGAGLRRGGHGGETGGYVGREDVENFDAYRSGEFAKEFQRFAACSDASYTLGAILIDLAEANVFV